VADVKQALIMISQRSADHQALNDTDHMHQQ
jgi:hypothetical protein